VIPTNLNEERQLRAWAVEAAIAAQGGEGKGAKGVDLITAAQRIVDFVKGDGAAKKTGEKS
jgi:hypothetical protein